VESRNGKLSFPKGGKSLGSQDEGHNGFVFFGCFGLPLFGGEQPKKNKMLFAPETQEFSICQKHPLK
jgi:hypothetical protein